jgi:hypothetical protein
MSYNDQQLKKAKEEFRRKKMLEASGAASGTFISQTGRSVTMGTPTSQGTFEAFPPFLRFTEKVLNTDPDIARIPADTYRKMLRDQENREFALAKKYVSALGTPAEDTREYTVAVNEAWAHSVPYLRFMKAIQLNIKADSVRDPAVAAHPDYWTFIEFKKLTTQQRDELSMVVAVCLTNAGLDEYCGVELSHASDGR